MAILAICVTLVIFAVLFLAIAAGAACYGAGMRDELDSYKELVASKDEVIRNLRKEVHKLEKKSKKA